MTLVNYSDFRRNFRVIKCKPFSLGRQKGKGQGRGVCVGGGGGGERGEGRRSWSRRAWKLRLVALCEQCNIQNAVEVMKV